MSNFYRTGSPERPTAADSTGPDRSSLEPTWLLVSVATAEEAVAARQHGADWIDLKDPLAGSLGAPQLLGAQTIGQLLSGFSRRSIALGELQQISHVPYAALVGEGVERFPVAKTGLAGVQHQPWQAEFQALAAAIAPTHLIPVLYADGARCDAADWHSILELLEAAPVPFLLIDTYVKDGRGLLHWLQPAALLSMRRILDALGTRLVIAGSLTLADLPSLQAVRPAAIAVRGAVCIGSRTGSLCGARVQQWSQSLAQQFGRTASGTNVKIGQLDGPLRRDR